QPRDRQPSELDAEQDHEQEREPEVGRGEADEDEHRRDLVEGRVLPGRAVHADGDGQGDDDQQLGDVQEQGDGQTLTDLLQDGPRGANGSRKPAGTSRPSQFQYCTASGLSRPYISRSSCRAWALDLAPISPACRSTGSPGARWMTAKVMKVMPRRRGKARTR